MYEAEKLLEGFPGGSEIIVHHIGTAKSLRLAVVVWAGMFHDPDGKEGLAHIFEHLSIAGTKRYPSKLALTDPVESVGGKFRAFTDFQRTVFLVDVPVGASILGWTILQEMVFHSLRTEEALTREKEIIAAEITYLKGHRSEQDTKRMYSILFGSDLGKKTWGGGTLDTLATITSTDVEDFFQRYYQMPMSIIAVGNTSRLLGIHTTGEIRHSKNLPVQDSRLHWIPSPEAIPEPWVSYEVPGKSTLCISGIFPARQYCTDMESIANLLPAITIVENLLVTRGLSSVLIQECREKRQLTYTHGWVNNPVDGNFGSWHLFCPLKRTEDSETLRTILQDILTDPKTFSDQAVEKAKSSVHGQLEQDWLPQGLGDFYMDSLVARRKIISVDDWLEQIQAVDPQSVRDFAAECFHPSKWVEFTLIPK